MRFSGIENERCPKGFELACVVSGEAGGERGSFSHVLTWYDLKYASCWKSRNSICNESFSGQVHPQLCVDSPNMLGAAFSILTFSLKCLATRILLLVVSLGVVCYYSVLSLPSTQLVRLAEVLFFWLQSRRVEPFLERDFRGVEIMEARVKWPKKRETFFVCASALV